MSLYAFMETHQAENDRKRTRACASTDKTNTIFSFGSDDRLDSETIVNPSSAFPVAFAEISRRESPPAALLTRPAAIVAWINTHPPGDLQEGQCAACGDDLGDQYVVLGDSASVHYSGPHGDRCYRRWQQVRRNEAEQQLFCGDNE